MTSFEGVDATQWSELEPHYQNFLNREIDSADALEGWLLDLGRFDAYVGETGSMLYVNMTCDTENEEVKQAYLDFVENVEPGLAGGGFAEQSARKQAAHSRVLLLHPTVAGSVRRNRRC